MFWLEEKGIRVGDTVYALYDIAKDQRNQYYPTACIMSQYVIQIPENGEFHTVYTLAASSPKNALKKYLDMQNTGVTVRSIQKTSESHKDYVVVSLEGKRYYYTKEKGD